MSEYKPTIPPEALGSNIAPGFATPSAFTFSADSKQLLFLRPGDNEVQGIWSLNTETGEARLLIAAPEGGLDEANLTPEEVLRRQRLRQMSRGITRFQLHPQSGRLLIPLEGLYQANVSGTPLQKILDKSVQNPTLSPNGELIAYVENGNIWVMGLEDGLPHQITESSDIDGITDGLAEYMAQEELGRMEGFWWSPDSQWLAFTEVDERHIPQYRIMHAGKSDLNMYEEHRYPFAGEQNAHVRLAVVPAIGGTPQWMNLDYSDEIYIARVFWWDNNQLGAEILNRPQTRLDIVRFDIQTGTMTTILTQENDLWIDMRHKHLLTLDDGAFLLASESSDFNHIYHYDKDGNLLCQLTDGDWQVDDLLCVDKNAGVVYFTGNREHPTEKYCYRVPLAGGAVERITRADGFHHTTTISPDFKLYVDYFSSLTIPPTITLRSLANDTLKHTIHTPNDVRLTAWDLPAPEIVSLPSRDGVTLYGALYRPPQHFKAPYPTIVYPYGGPGPQMVGNHYGLTSNVLSQYLREKGFAVLRLDNRGSARRGQKFEGALKNRMGTIEIEDQIDGVKWLIAQGITDAHRVGIHGYSYGGYMTLLGMLKAPDVFKVGVCGSPVAEWEGYDTTYTERYMGTPQSNPDGYQAGSMLKYVQNLRGKLLITHGFLDENVHFRHTVRLIQALVEANKDYDLLILPEERHSPRFEAGRLYLWSRVVRYFEQHL
jgi:dipeptidyl-peptidase 4